MAAEQIALATSPDSGESGITWKTVEWRSHEFHRSLAVAILSKGCTRSEDLFLELAPCHEHIYATDCYRWLDIHNTHRNKGCERVQQLGLRLFPEASLRWIPGERFKEKHETSFSAGRVDIQSRHTMVNIPWLTAYLLLVTVEGKAIKDRDPVRRAKELLQLMASLPSSELRASCAGGGVIGHQCAWSVWKHG